jgi:hypothetical protein
VIYCRIPTTVELGPDALMQGIIEVGGVDLGRHSLQVGVRVHV